ncbi:MAG TPA: hypothetical protein VD948_11255, partial [Rhodothermales bacterium]|nr:hypothetical protein [Rhodothermales bacterium]
MSADLIPILFVASIAAAAFLEVVARQARGALQTWARGVVTWSGLLWTALVIIALADAVFDSADDLLGGFLRAPLLSLCVGGAFYTGGFLAERLGARLGWRPWATQALVLATAVPSTLAGYALNVLLLWPATGEAPFWHADSSLFESITLWLISTIAVFVGFVRLLYNVRLQGLEADRARLSAETTAARLTHLEERLRPH